MTSTLNQPGKADANKSNKSSFDQACFLSRIYCCYVFSFLYRNYRKDFGLEAIEPCPKDDVCDKLGLRLSRHWNAEVLRRESGKSASLLRAIAKCFGWQFFRCSVYNFFVYGVFRMVMAIILGRIIFYSSEYFDEKLHSTQPEGLLQNVVNETAAIAHGKSDLINQWLQLSSRQNVIVHSAFLAIVVFINVCVSHPNFMRKYRYGMNVRVAVSRLIYEKSLRLTSQSVQRISMGKIVNLVSNDANRFDNAFVYSDFLYMAWFEAAVGMYFTYQYIGRSCLGLLAIIALYVPFQMAMARLLNRFRVKSIKLTDDRLRLMAEILPAMKVIKMYVWEKPFSALVATSRKLEIAKIRKSMIFRGINLALDFVAPKAMSFVCLVLYILDGGQLTAENVFVTMALIAQIRDIITSQFPLGITCAVEAYVSIQRIEGFLLEEEIEDAYQLSSTFNPDGSKKEPKIIVSHATVTSELNKATILKDISFEVTPGKLTVVVGAVGSGKSSVLLSILKELPLSQGRVEVQGKMIYAPQEAWIFSGTVRDNILFGRSYDIVRYKQVVKAAALSEDIKQFQDGDQTMVDDRGTSLSGGQRARISLARALYTNADCYLLDDPLAAVDAQVAKHIFEKCIKQYLKDKCVILVTHQLQFIKQADQIVVLKDGAALAVGSYIDIVNQGIDVFKYSAAEQEKNQQEGHTDSPVPSSPSMLRSAAFRHLARSDSFGSHFGSVVAPSEIDCASTVDFSEDDYDYCTSNQMQQHQTEMAKSKKASKFAIYLIYFRAGAGILLFCTFFLSNLFTQVLFTGSDYWLSAWTDYLGNEHTHTLNSNFTFSVNPIISTEQNTNILIYSAIVVLLFIFSFARTFSFFIICMRASVNLHNRTFDSLIQAPIQFFDKTPVGIIINRMSRDLGIIDDLLPPAAFEALEILCNSFGVFLLCTLLNYFIAIPFLVLMTLIYFANRFYVNTARKIKRLEGVARSPMLNQMASSLTGLATIRSYQMEDLFIGRFSSAQDLHSSAYFTFISASRFYGIFLEFICVAYIYCFVIVMNINLDSYTSSLIGLTISQTLQLTNVFNWGIRLYTEVETHMTSVERVNEFAGLDTEELDKCARKPSLNWPVRGDILYQNVSLLYNSDAINEDQEQEPPKVVLRDLTFSINGGEKIGIVGRTGAGKSSLITTVFRLAQPQGTIWIDGMNTGDMSLSRLRKNLSIIPQEPILFSGDIRRNLDPFNEKSDEELWSAIDKVQLKAKIQSLPGMLNAPVSECGADFSVGQKQLICMARAILRKNRILILDEATANVDPGTDSLIQATIRTEFAHCTVLTIAHRLNTIIDYDRVMVLDAGSLSQFDSPYELLQLKCGIFYELFCNLNRDTKIELLRLAKRAHMLKQSQTQM